MTIRTGRNICGTQVTHQGTSITVNGQVLLDENSMVPKDSVFSELALGLNQQMKSLRTDKG